MRMTNAIDTLSSKNLGGNDTGVVAAAAAFVPALRAGGANRRAVEAAGGRNCRF
jgi:hypothetical protein